MHLSSRHRTNLDNWIYVEKIVEYVQEHQNEDGGYSFAQGAESGARDTYYAIKILKSLHVEPRRQFDIARFLRYLQESDGSFDSINVAYYVVEALHELQSKPSRSFNRFVLSTQKSDGGFGSLEADMETSETTYMALKLLELADWKLDLEKTIKLILSFRNPEGSFGISGRSTSASTYYALSILKLAGFDVRSLSDTLKWVRSCEIPTGGFRGTPASIVACILMKDNYFDVEILRIMGETCHYPNETLGLISRFQNSSGGFRRSIFLRNPTCESTYQAVSASLTILDMLEGRRR
jgi:hypothetical protein